MLIVYTNMLVFSLNKTINIKCFTRTWMTLPNVTARIGPMMGDTSLRDRESGRAGERERGRGGVSTKMGLRIAHAINYES